MTTFSENFKLVSRKMDEMGYEPAFSQNVVDRGFAICFKTQGYAKNRVVKSFFSTNPNIKVDINSNMIVVEISR